MDTLEQQREITLGVIRWIQRQAPCRLSWKDAQAALDDFARVHPDTVAAIFWKDCSDNQYRLLRRDFNRWRQS